MWKVVNLGIELPRECFKHIEEISYYNHNYYKIEHYGDWFYGELDVLYQEYNECENCCSYALGTIENGKFKGVVYWTAHEDILDCSD